MLLSRLIDIMITLKKALASPGSRGGGRGGVVGSRGPGVGWGIATFLPNCNKTPFEGSLRAFSGTVFQMFQMFQNGRFMFQSVPMFQMFQVFQVFQMFQRSKHGDSIKT